MELDILRGLNDEQKDAVTSIDGYIRVIAGAGSGKTRALTHRYAYLVKECGISPSSILSVTFTNKAAQEMRDRIRNMIGDQDLGYICTFHGLCVRILREDIHYLHYPSNFTILDQDDQKLLLADVYDTLKIDDYLYQYYNAMTDIAKLKVKNLSYYISNVTDPNGFNPRKSNVFSEYLKLQRKNYALDFNDLLYFTIYLLINFDAVREKWQDRLEYIQVDEFQDVSSTEYQLVSILSEKHKNLFIVGDPDQTIYSWRGSKIKFILDFHKAFKNVHDISMLKNYRSSNEIINCSNSLIGHNDNRIKKSLIAATNSQSQNKCKVVHYHSKSQTGESQWIAKEIKKLNNQGCDFKDIAILYRARYSVPALEAALNKEEIPYKICDGISFYSRQEIKIIIAYFTFILKQDDMSFKKIINKPNREIGKRRMDLLKDISQNKDISLYQALMDNIDNPIFRDTKAKEFLTEMDTIIAQYKDLKVSDIADMVISITGYEYKLMTNNDDEEFNSIAELKNQISDAETNRGEKMSLQDYLDDVALATSVDLSKDESRVSLMTIHSSKGLEFKNVFVYEMNEGTFPAIRTDTLERMEEERRLAYVALTRAQDRLYLTDAEGMSENNPQARYTSRFIYNISPELFDQNGEYSKEYPKEKALQSIFNSENNLSKIGSHDIGETINHYAYGKGIIEGIDLSTDSYIIRFEDSVRNINRKDNITTLNERGSNDIPDMTEPKIAPTVESTVFSVGDRVKHNVFGEGIVKSINSYKRELSVKFEKYETERKIYDSSKLAIIEKAENQDVLGLNSSIKKYAIGDKVLHPVYGFGIVKEIKDKEYIINFVSGTEKAILEEKHLKKVSEEQYEKAFDKSTIFCPECQSKVSIGTTICPECGYNIGD